MTYQVFATIIIPTYNQAKFLPAALDSLIAQTDPDWEAIVVNDGSTDNTEQIAKKYSERDPRIKYFSKNNGGVASALNFGLTHASGKWIHWLSSDDMFEPNKLEINRRWILQKPDVKFFFSYFTLLHDATGVREKRGLWGPLPKAHLQIITLFYRNYISGISICVDRNAWGSVGFFDESLHYAQDYDQWLKLLQKFEACFIPEWTVISRNHCEQGSETFSDACYFDTAKAAIEFINNHDFKQLLPFLDFNDSDLVQESVKYVLEICSDKTSFLYSSGYHPALVLRVIQWLHSGDVASNNELRSYVRKVVVDNSFQDASDDWTWMWRQLATIIVGENQFIEYEKINILDLELREYRQRKTSGNPKAQPLYDYIKKFESLTPNNLPVIGEYGPRVAVLIKDTKQIHHIESLLTRISEMGCRNAVLVEMREEKSILWQLYPWGEILYLKHLDKESLPWLGEVDLCLTLDVTNESNWVISPKVINISTEISTDEIEGYLNDVFFYPKKNKRPVVFLERVLSGGGAERVVYDLVRYLDRRYFRPIVITMYPEHTNCLTFPRSVEIFHINEQMAVSNTCALQKEIQYTSLVSYILLNTYRLLTTNSVRQRLKLGTKLNRVRSRFAESIKSFLYCCKFSAIKESEIKKICNDENWFSVNYPESVIHYNRYVENLLIQFKEFTGNPVMISVMEEASIVAWLAQAGIKIPHIVSLHTFESKCLVDIFPSPNRRRVERHFLAASCSDAIMVTMPSDGCIDDLLQTLSLSRDNVRKIGNPIDSAMVNRLSNYHDARASQWSEQDQVMKLVFVGRLDPQKNPDLLLDACAELKRRSFKFSLAIIGSGNMKEHLLSRIKELNISKEVSLIGELRNPFPWIKAADALLLTSKYEAFGLVLLEAMICGTPVVSVDCPSGPREVLGNGEYGVLVNNDDPNAIADGIMKLKLDSKLRNKLIESGYARAVLFDIKKIVKVWEAEISAISMCDNPSIN